VLAARAIRPFGIGYDFCLRVTLGVVPTMVLNSDDQSVPSLNSGLPLNETTVLEQENVTSEPINHNETA